MGTITRSFANNITTSGVLLPSSLTNNSIANVTAYNSAIATGGMVLLSTGTGSASSSINFTTNINSTYKEYQFYFIDLRANGSDVADLQCNFSIDAGSNWNVSKTTTNFGAYHTQSDSVADLAYESGSDLGLSTGYQKMNTWQYMGRASTDSLTGYMSLYNPSSTTYHKNFIWITQHNQASICDNTYGQGYCSTTSAINGVTFRASVGNIDGTILMYGIV
jgi:hypothetical protein